MIQPFTSDVTDSRPLKKAGKQRLGRGTPKQMPVVDAI